MHLSQSKSSTSNKSLVMNGDEVVDLSLPRKKKHVTDEQKNAAQQESKKFQQFLKNDMRHFDIDNSGSFLVNEMRFTSKWQTVKVIVFKGKRDEFNYPFKTTKDFLGVVCSSQYANSPQLVFEMYQESKQREKNSEHLSNLLKHRIVTDQFLMASDQQGEVLPVAITREDQFLLLDDMQRQKLDSKKDSQIQTALFKLQFFHTWLFYYFYSADHKLVKAILKGKFPFAHHLFQFELDLLRRRHL